MIQSINRRINGYLHRPMRLSFTDLWAISGPFQTLPIESLFSVFENPQVLALCAPNKMSRVNEIEVFGNELLVTE